MRDERWNQIVFHGVNVVYKRHPFLPNLEQYHPQESLTLDDIRDLKAWGMNFVRLGVSWEAVEIEAPGSTESNLKTMYNYTYLAEVDKVIQRLANEGIYTMIDAHQDVLARMICGQGMPNFYARQIAKNAQCVASFTQQAVQGSFQKYGVCKNFREHYRY